MQSVILSARHPFSTIKLHHIKGKRNTISTVISSNKILKDFKGAKKKKLQNHMP